jgi:tetratricopeptide (TPR) repeat protein
MKVLAGLLPCLFTACLGYGQQTDTLSLARNLLLNEEYRKVLDLTVNYPKTSEIDSPDSLRARMLFYRGTAYQELSVYDSALQCFVLAGKLHPGNRVCIKAQGSALQKLGRTREAVAVCEQLVQTDSSDRKSQADLAALYWLRHEYLKSIAVYRQLLKEDSLNYYFLKQNGRNYLELNRDDSALVFFEAAFRQNPADAFLTHQIANLYLRKKDLDLALYSLQQGFIYDTSNLDLLKLRGYLWMLSHEYQRAIRDLEKARLQAPSSLFVLKYLGMSYHEEKQYEQAREALLLAFKLDSTDEETAYFLGSACRWSKFEEDGVYYYRKAVELQQPDPQNLKNIYIQLAELLKVLHRFDEALDSYRNALAQDPSDNTLYFKIGQVYDQNLHKKSTAIEYYEKYLSGNHTDQQLFNAAKGTSQPLEKHVRERITSLKQELFMEE